MCVGTVLMLGTGVVSCVLGVSGLLLPLGRLVRALILCVLLGVELDRFLGV